jgi:hypothetical protein
MVAWEQAGLTLKNNPTTNSLDIGCNKQLWALYSNGNME